MTGWTRRARNRRADRPERVRMRHGDDVIAGIDEMNFAGDAGREVGKKIKSGAAEFVERYAAMQRRMPLLEREHQRASPMPAPASVRIGPDEMALTRIFWPP